MKKIVELFKGKMEVEKFSIYSANPIYFSDEKDSFYYLKLLLNSGTEYPKSVLLGIFQYIKILSLV